MSYIFQWTTSVRAIKEEKEHCGRFIQVCKGVSGTKYTVNFNYF